MTVDRVVVWDYDGTLVDTGRKNWQVTRALIPAVSGRPLAAFPALASLAAYRAADRRAANWRDLYAQEFGLPAEQVTEAGRLWTRYQLADRTPTPFFTGVRAALARLEGVPQAIFSQNSRAAINRALLAAGLEKQFQAVVGYEEVGFERQKPAPDGLIWCIEKLAIRRGTVYFVGDHDTDFACARAADGILAGRDRALKVVAVGAAFGEASDQAWANGPAHVARQPQDVVDVVIGER